MASRIESGIKIFITMFFLGCFASSIIFHDKHEYGPEKSFVVDKSSISFRAFQPTWKEDFSPNDFFYYVQEADNTDSNNNRKIIVRRKADGIFFAVQVRNSSSRFKKGEEIKLEIIRYWQSPTALIEYLIVK